MADLIKQIQCWSDWSDYSPVGSNTGIEDRDKREPQLWSMNSEFDYGQVLFHTPTTQEDMGKKESNWQYYQEQWEDEDYLETVWNVVFEPRHFLQVPNQHRTTATLVEDIDNYITNNDVHLSKFSSNFILKFTLKKYAVPIKFSVILKNSSSGSELMMQTYSFDANEEPKEQVLFVGQASLNSATFISFDQIIFKIDRAVSPDVTLEFTTVNLLNLYNLISEINSDSTNNRITSMTVETLGIGECVFYINNDIFYIGNDHMLTIPMDMNIDIYNINYITYIKELPNKDTASISNKPFITCLINLTYEKKQEGYNG